MKEKPGRQVMGMVVSLLIIIGIPKEPVMRVVNYLRFRGIGEESLRMLVEHGTVELAMTVVLLLAVIFFLVSFFRLIRIASRPRVPGLNQPRVRQKEEGDSTVQYVSKSDRDKYMMQLDSYLQNGIVTKEEYLVLRQRYESRR